MSTDTPDSPHEQASSQQTETRYYVRRTSTQDVFGPISGETVKQWLVERRINAADFVRKDGEESWLQLPQSVFGEAAVEQMKLTNLSQSVCPRCGSQMVTVVGRDNTAFWLIWIGAVLSPLCIGVPLLIIGLVMNSKKTGSYFSCPTCKYMSR